ncbi:MAG TPA: extracellular solute-binding protein [Phycisphaeraceae bacterium]
MAKAVRFLLALAAALLVVWSFIDVGARVVRSWRADRRAVTLTILHWGTPEENAIVQRLVDRFEQAHPDIRIEDIHANNYDPKLKTMFAAGTPPDLFYMPSDSLPEFASMNLLMNLSPLIEQEQAAGQAQWLSDFYPMLLDVFRYDGRAVGRGSLYGLPKDFTTMVMYVNLDLFERAGVPVPYEGWTWQEYEAAMRRITALSDPTDRTGPIYGGVIQTYPQMLRQLIWSWGGEFFGGDGADFRDVRLGDPHAQAALDLIYRTRFIDRNVYNITGVGKDPGEMFETGKIGCIGPLGRWVVPRYRSIRSFRWDIVPVPHREGLESPSAIATVAWSISRQTKHPREAYELLKFLCGPEGQVMSTKLGLAIPSLKSVAESDAFLSPGETPANNRLFLDLIPRMRVAQNPPGQQFNRILDEELAQSLRLGLVDNKTAAQRVAGRWLAELDSPLRQREFPRLSWPRVGQISGAVVLVVVMLAAWRLSRQKLGRLGRKEERIGWLFISPWIIGFAALTLGPMVVSLVLAFTQWTAMTPLEEARFVGLANFRHLFREDPTFVQSLKVTVYYVVLAVPLGQAAALAIAMLMAQKVRGIAVFRTVYFIPSIITGVVLATLWLSMFNSDYGLLNYVLRPICELFGARPPDWFGRDGQIWAVPALVIMSLWGVGGGMIIYLAALKGVPASLYEAARMDGAGRWRQFLNVTLPMISPLVFFNLVMGIIGSFQVFTQAYVMTSGGPGNATLFYVLNLYRQAFEFHHMGYASAMAWVLFVILVALTALVVRSSRRWVYYEGLKA